jgi:hypothetical protein
MQYAGANRRTLARLVDIVTRLELNLKAAVGAAMANLIAADLRALWATLEPMLNSLPDAEQLRIGGLAIAELAEICQLKAERLLADWEEQHNETGPAMAEDLLTGLVQRTMYLEISDLIRQPQPRQRFKSQRSIVGLVEKADLLALLATQGVHEPDSHASHAAALAVAHQENPSAWVERVAAWMQTTSSDAVSLPDLQRSLNMPLIELWLALLLGGYRLEARGGFYETEQIWITVA